MGARVRYEKPKLRVPEWLLETLGNDDKPVVYFENKEKGLVLNKTNATVIAAGYGPETDGWVGKPITLYPAKVSFQGQMVAAIRVELPVQDAGDDEIPF